VSIERTPPQSEEFERAVLGACLLSVESVAQAVEALRPADFYRHAHGRLFGVLAELYRKGQPVDLLTVYAAAGDDLELNTLAREVYGEIPTTAHTGYYRCLSHGPRGPAQ
jgi:replicative DNA helicase